MTEQEIQTLIRSIQSGEKDRFGQIFDLFSDKIFRHISFRVRDREVAKDLTSEVFLGAWQSLPRYQPKNGAKFSTWLFSIARRILADYYRQHQKEIGRVSLDDVADIWPDQQASPSDQAYLNLTVDQISLAISQLPPDMAEAVTLHYIDEMKYEEMAIVTHKPPSHLRVLVHRGLQRIKKLLNHD